MKIVIDTTPLKSGHKSRGVGRYTRSLVEALQRLHSPHEIILTSEIGCVSHVNLIHYPYFDLFHSHLPLFKSAPLEVVTVHDLIPLRFPKQFKPGIRSGINKWYQLQAIRRVDAVITDSACSKNDIEKFTDFDSERIHVIGLAAGEEFRKLPLSVVSSVRKRYKLPDKFILYVGDINANKNILALIASLVEIPNIHLVIVSSALKNSSLAESKLIHSAIDKYHLHDRVIELSNLPIDDKRTLAAIYNASLAYVQPSLYEGFGLPILEAMACEIPVVSSDVASLPEVAGGAALLVKPTSQEIARGVKKILEDDPLRKTLCARGLARTKQLTWEKTAQETLSVYEQLFKQ